MHYILHDENGPQKQEVIWILEKIRRAAHVLYINYHKMNPRELESSIDQIFDYLIKCYDAVNGNSTKSAAINELRRMVKQQTP